MTPDERFQKIERGMQDLIAVARITLDSVSGLKVALEDYAIAAEARSQEQDARMDRLIDNINRFLRGERPNGKE